MNNNNSSTIRSHFKTTHDVDEFLRLLEGLNGQLFKQAFTSREILDKLLPYSQADLIKRLASEYNISIEDKHEMESFFIALQHMLKGLPVISLTLAVIPSQEGIDYLSNWFYINFQKNVIIDIQYNPDILGGAIIAFNGKYGDYSLKKHVEKLFLSNINN